MQVPVARPELVESTSLGAALAAGLGVGFWTREETLDGSEDDVSIFNPAITSEAADKRYELWKFAVSRSFGLAKLGEEGVLLTED